MSHLILISFKTDIMNTRRKINIRAECPQCAGGQIGHMTVDELLERTLKEGCSLACPHCGRMHLNREEIDQLEREKIIYTDRYRQIRMQAESISSD